MKCYLAGPMRGYPLHNFPAFDAAEEALTKAGHLVFSPAQHDRQIGYDPNLDPTPEQLKIMFPWDLRAVMEVDAVVFLPGWELSRGARSERVVAHYMGKQCFDYVDGQAVPQCAYEEPIVTWVQANPHVATFTIEARYYVDAEYVWIQSGGPRNSLGTARAVVELLRKNGHADRPLRILRDGDMIDLVLPGDAPVAVLA